MGNCRSGCATQDHSSYGACLRAANLQVGWSRSAQNLDRTAEKKKLGELDNYKRLRDQGIQPDGTYSGPVRFAEEMSNRFGAAYGEDFHVIPTGDRRGYEPVFKKDVDRAMNALPEDMKAIYDTAKNIPGSGVH